MRPARPSVGRGSGRIGKGGAGGTGGCSGRGGVSPRPASLAAGSNARGRGGGHAAQGATGATAVPELLLAELPEDLKQLRAEVLAGLDSGSGGSSGSDASDDGGGGRSLDGVGADAAGRRRGRRARGAGSDAPVARQPGRLYEADILEASGETCLEDVVQLVLRERALALLGPAPELADTLWEQLTGLEVLSLSHNALTSIVPLSSVSSLMEVNINFNQIEDLSPLYDCPLLTKLFAANNRVKSIDGLALGCASLQELSLFSNCLSRDCDAVQALGSLQELRSLDIGQNDFCARPSQRCALIQALPSLEYLDGTRITAADRARRAEFLAEATAAAEAGDAALRAGDETPTRSELIPPCLRPGTAPPAFAAPRAPRPPPLPGKMLAAASSATASQSLSSLSPLPGQRLRSSRANRIDDVLSREPSPDASDGAMALDVEKLDLRNPAAAFAALTAHIEALSQRLQVVRMDRDNLKFMCSQMQREKSEAGIDALRERIQFLKTENKNTRAIDIENSQLKARLVALDQELKDLQDGKVVASNEVADVDDDALDALRLENKMLEKRYKRLTSYAEDLQQDAMRVRLTSSAARRPPLPDGAAPAELAARAGAGGGDLDSLVAQNEAMLRLLRCEVRETATAVARRTAAGLSEPAAAARASAKATSPSVDVLTIGEGPGSTDVEWHAAA